MITHKPKKSIGSRIDQNLGYWFLIPGVLCLLILVVAPVCVTISQSFTNITFLTKGKPKFVGLNNYLYLFKQKKTFIGLQNTFVWTVLSVGFQFLFGFILAQALQRIRRGKAFFRSALIIPWTFPAIVMTFAWRWMLDPTYGVINQIITMFGGVGRAWFSLRNCLLVVVVMNIWFGAPFMMMSIYAGFQTIPNDQYEVGRLEGANYFQELWYITLPNLKEIIGTVLILRTIWVFNNFDFVYLTTGGGPGTSSLTMAIYSYNTMWKDMQIGRASAISVLLLIFVLVFVVLYFVLFQRGGRIDE